jgi:cytochrome c oxidase subunit 1
MTGRMYSSRLGKLHFWLAIVGFNLTFLPMFIAGLQGMNRRIADYLPHLEPVNLWVSLAGFFFGASFLVFIWNYIQSWRKGEPAPDNPWQAYTLEWQTTSPPPIHNFEEPPVVVGDPYCYGEEDQEHAVVGRKTEP